MDPMTFLSRLAAQVPAPRVHVVSYYGVLAPAASRRDEIVPGYEEVEERSGCQGQPSLSDLRAKRGKRFCPERLSWAELAQRVW